MENTPSLESTFLFHLMLEKEISSIDYGTLSFAITLKNGKPLMETLQITRQKRRKYKVGGETIDD